MKQTLILLSYACCLLPLALPAAVPLSWTVETSRATPAQFEAYQGETIQFEAALQSHGKPLEMSGLAAFFWQTNGMGSAYWQTSAAVNSNRLSAVFTPEMDVGAKVYNCFIGSPSNIYHAAFQLRLRPSPGATPNVLPLPVPVIDFAKVRVLNPPWPTGGTDTNAVIDIIHETVSGAARPVPKYLHALDFDDSYPDDAEMYYKWRGGINSAGGCSAVRRGGYLSRNFDFPFDDRAEFVVRMSASTKRFASVGVAQVGTNLTEAIVTSGKPSRWYKALPGATVDGINSEGVVAEINVVDGDPATSGWHTNVTSDAIHPLAAIRWILDNATNAYQAATYLAANIRFPQGWAQNFHYMVADAEKTYIVENGTVTDGDEYHEPDEPVTMTNFQLSKFPWDGMGMERFGLLLGGANITNAWYTRAYRRETNPPWVSDLAEVLAYTNAIFDAWAAHDKEYFRGKTNNGIPWWQTVHTSIYDITNRTLRISVQETDDWYTFAVPATAPEIDAYTRVETDAKLASAAVSATNYTDSCCSTLSVSVARLESATNDLASSVSGLRSSKLDRGEKVALSAVTNAQGSAVTAADVGALPAVDPYDQAASVYWDQIGFNIIHPFIFFNAALNVWAPNAKITSKAIVGDVPNGGLYLGSGIGGSDPYISIRHDNGTRHDYISFLDGSEIRFADHSENIDQRIARLAPAPGNYASVSNAAMNAATKAEMQETKTEMQETKQVVYTWESFLDGSNVVFSITNYLSGTYSLDHAKLQIKELRPGETEYRIVYDSRTEITNHTETAKRQLVGYVDGKVTELRGEIAGKGDKAWGRVSSTGQEVPISNTVWVTEQNLRIAGGMEYERVAVGEGAIYVLSSKGQTPYMQGDEGSLMLKDDGGTNYFGMVRSDSYTIGCNTDGIRVQNGLVYLNYSVTMSNHPVVWYTPTLEGEIVWEQLNLPDGSAVPGASHEVVWDESPRLGAQECYINVGNAPSGFFKATIEVPGDCRFKTNMPAEVPSFFCSDDPTKKVKIIWNGGNPKLVEAN